MDTIPQKFNGISGFPYNQWWDSYDDLQKQGVIPEDFQAYSGYGAYIEGVFHKISDLDLITLDWFFEYNYYYQLANFNLKGNWIYPYWSYDYIMAIKKYSAIKNLKIRIAEAVSNKVTGTNHIKRPTIPEVEKRGYRTCGASLLNQIDQEYKRTWYGRFHKTKPNGYINYTKWWTDWCAAGICEHLLNKGHIIR